MLEVRIEKIETRQQSTRFQSHNLLCFTREQVKREEKEILQCHTTSLYIHFIYHPQIISHAPMYLLNLPAWFCTPSTQLLSMQSCHIIQHCNTSAHFLIILNYTATILPIHPCLPTSLPFRNTIPSPLSPHICYLPYVFLYHTKPWQHLMQLPIYQIIDERLTIFRLITVRRQSGRYSNYLTTTLHEVTFEVICWHCSMVDIV